MAGWPDYLVQWNGWLYGHQESDACHTAQLSQLLWLHLWQPPEQKAKWSWIGQAARWAENLARILSTMRTTSIQWLVTSNLLQTPKLGPVLFNIFVDTVYDETERRSQKLLSQMRGSVWRPKAELQSRGTLQGNRTSQSSAVILWLDSYIDFYNVGNLISYWYYLNSAGVCYQFWYKW